MHKCACTTIALERFISDLAGITLRHQRVQHLPRSGPGRRTFGTSARRFTAIEAVRIGDDFVPFVERRLADAQGRSLEHSTGAENGKRDGSAAVEGSTVDGHNWHAEIEIKDAGAAKALAMAPVAEDGAEHINDGALEAAVGETEPIPDKGLLSSAARKQLNRAGRKQRRIAAGTYKPSATLRQGEETEESRTASVLDKIDGMDGPDPSEDVDLAGSPGIIEEDFISTKARARGLPGQPVRPSTRTATKEPPAPVRRKKEPWQVQKAALTAKFGDATWSPRKRLSPDTLEGIRTLNSSDPNTYNTATLSQQFAVSPENIRRILRSKWQPNETEREDRAERWERRGVRKWTAMAEGGERPPKKWREMGVGSVRGEPEAKPAWKKGGVTSRLRSEVVPFESMEDVAVATLNARIL
ncbi:Required for respiratory growth protein 9 mitochondrial [Oleoguttula sp. CCFEE 5521]